MPESATTELAEKLERSVVDLNAVREQFKDTHDRVEKLVKQQDVLTKSGDSGGTELKKVQATLLTLADTITSQGNENTNLLGQVRQLSRMVGESGENPDRSFVLRGQNPLRSFASTARSAIFTSRRQAVEIGMFFMATMKVGHSKAYALNWLKERAADLKYLPRLPESLLQHLGTSHQDIIHRHMMQGFSDEVVQASATSVAPGSLLTFPQFADMFIRNVEEHGVFRQEALIWPMPGDTMIVPRRTGGITLTWEGEGDSLAETQPSVDQLRLIAKKVAAIHFMANELREDENAAITFADLLVSEYALAIAIEEDRIGFNGDGAGGSSPGFAGFFGVLGLPTAALASEVIDSTISVTAGTGNDLTSEVTLKKLREMTGALHTWAKGNARLYAHRTVISDLMGIESSGGGQVRAFLEGNSPTIMGYPVREVEGLPQSPGTASTAAFTLGDLRKAVIFGDKREPTVETSEHFRFQNDQLAIRMTSRFGIRFIHANAMVVYITAA